MIIALALKGIGQGRSRFLCAVAGIAIATGAYLFTSSLVTTNAAQSRSRAASLLASLPLEDGRVAALTLDHRPGGRVMQGPPMRAVVQATTSVSGDGALVTRALFRQRRLEPPAVGETLKLVGRNGTYTLRIAGVLDWETPVRGVPNVFVSPAAAAKIGEEWRGFAVPTPEDLAPLMKGDEERRMDYATPLLNIAALLTALALLVNTLLLSVESNRRALAVLRTVGLTRLGTVGVVTAESLVASAAGWALGTLLGAAALAVYVACDRAAFPAGVAFDCPRIAVTLAVLAAVAFAAVLFALAPALRVRPMDAAAAVPRRRRRGMAVAFALGFAAFVAVEVWGASLMRGFVPSPEWPDAIVSLLPSGVSSYDVEKLRDIDGVARISELVPRQLFLSEKMDLSRVKAAAQRMRRPVEGRQEAAPSRAPAGPNALFLAAEWLPDFVFVEGDRAEAAAAVFGTDAVVITRMMSAALGLHRGDRLIVVRRGRGGEEELAFPIAGVVELNWHMVTSRGLVRGLNRMPPMTVGPVFCSLDTMGIVDPRTYMTEPAMSAPMTHLWVEYRPEFLARHGAFRAGRLVEEAVNERLGRPQDCTVRLHARDEIADGTLAHGTDVIGEAARVPFVFLAILAIGFVAMLVSEAESRRREFALLRAVGATGAQLAAGLVREALKTAFVGVLAGLPLGAAAGWFTSLSTAAVWPGMPHWFVVPWPVILAGGFGAVVFALFFAVPTALWLVRRDRRRPARGRKRR